MLKKIFKIWLILWLFFSVLFNVFAFDAKLSLDKTESDINDYVKLRVKINSDMGWNIQITKIKWLENFDIVSQSQSQSSSTSMVVVNWKTQSKTNMSINFDLVLKAKKKWKYTIWPAVLKKWKEEITTNKLSINITWDKLFVNGNHLKVNNNNNNNNNPSAFVPQAPPLKSKGRSNSKEEINTYDDVWKSNFKNNNSLYLLLGIMLILWLAWYFFVKNNKDYLDKFKEKKINPGVENKKEEEKEVDFNEKPVDIVYPQVNDSNFISDISFIFKQKIAKKYKISSIDNKTFDEIITEIWDKVEPKIVDLQHMINKAKYSNIILDNAKILEMVKEI